MRTVALARARGARGVRHGKLQIRQALDERIRQARLAGAGGGGKNEKLPFTIHKIGTADERGLLRRHESI